VAKVVIGVDPHKRLNAVVVLNHRGKVLARRQFANTSEGFGELAAFSHRWRPRTWAIEGCNGVGKHVAQRLVAAGERVVDVSTRRAALVPCSPAATAARMTTSTPTPSPWSACTLLISPKCAPMTVEWRCVWSRTGARSSSACAPSA
jgi:hypothetical protein